jgi:ABC-type Mn2+/Zn2+ transport system ATPase subunit
VSNSLLQVSNLSVELGGTEIISNLSFNVNAQDVLVILGPNGAGKTTLLRAILGVIPYKGTVHWSTKNISYLPPQEFLKRDNLPPFSIKDFFNFKTKDETHIKELLTDVGLHPEIINQQFASLSTGQFQRMLIAWALTGNPDVLLFDEPTSGIDIGGEETIYTLLHKFWKKKNLTIILVTHDLNIVWEHANQVLCLNKTQACLGHPTEVLTPEQLKSLYGTGLKYYEHHHEKKGA